VNLLAERRIDDGDAKRQSLEYSIAEPPALFFVSECVRLLAGQRVDARCGDSADGSNVDYVQLLEIGCGNLSAPITFMDGSLSRKHEKLEKDRLRPAFEQGLPHRVGLGVPCTTDDAYAQRT
jgi:hypothetical protein